MRLILKIKKAKAAQKAAEAEAVKKAKAKARSARMDKIRAEMIARREREAKATK